MSKIAIVGSSRLNKEEEEKARQSIEFILLDYESDVEIFTGDAHGVDAVVLELSPEYDVTVVKALDHNWEGRYGFKQRNILIGEKADRVFSIATKKIYDRRCYHCDEQDHDRTGGCWTKRYAIDKLGKSGETIVI